MPGIFGIWTTPEGNIDVNNLLRRQANCLTHYKDYQHTFFSIPGKIGFGKIDRGKSKDTGYYTTPDGKYTLFSQGRIYNIPDLLKQYVEPDGEKGEIELYSPENQEQKILSLYLNSGWSWLTRADGRFCIALYNSVGHSMEIVSDRFGYSPLYYYKNKDSFIFGCEIKAVLQSPEVSREIDKDAVSEFFTFGYMLEDHTWFEEVKVFPAGSIMKISINDSDTKKYWSWGNVRLADPPPTYQEAIEETDRLWKLAVKSRLSDDSKFAVALSGGLDSRAILAAIPDDLHPVDLITYGTGNCDDHRFARMAAGVKNDNLHFREIYSEDWLKKRIKFVGWTDGLLNILHMHPASILDFYHDNFDVVLNGFVGDAFLGAIFLGKEKEDPFESAFRQTYRGRPLGMEEPEARDYLKPMFEKYRITDELFITHQRSRRFILMGLNWLSMSVGIRAPFTYYPLVDYVLSLPPQWRRNSRFYIDFLNKKYPEYFKQIPWQKTGLPAGYPHIIVRARKKINAIKKKLKYFLNPGKTGVEKNDFCNYSEWFGDEKIINKIENLLLSKDSRWCEILDASTGRNVISGFIKSRKVDAGPETIGMLLNLEIFLRSL
ncbi:MAG: hypothetical protein K8T10_10915 [Candidatus Eremiobacteraeota bacterium]|nr:hypothetical protein [Candidatus Eremiobacteraeota bacterium]